MLRWIVGSSQRFRLIVAGVAVAIMFLGAVQLRDAKVDVLPEFSPTVVQVQTEALGLSSAEVERMITTPLEKDMLSGVAFLDEIRSESITSLSSVDLVFEPGTDVMDARQLVQERLALGPGFLSKVSNSPEMLQPRSSSNRVLMAEFSSASLSQIELSVLARWRVTPHLMGVQGVANVAVWANRDRQLQVLIDPERLAEQEVTVQQVVESTANALWFSPLSFVEASTPGTGGFIDGPNQRLPVRHVLPIRTAEDLAEVVVEGTGSPPLRLGEIADVVEQHQPLIGDTVGGDPGLMLVVEKLPGASTLEVTEGVETALAELGLGLPGVDVDTTVFRPATFIESALDNLAFALLWGGLLLIAMLALVFASWRATLVTLASIVLAVVAAGLVLFWLGATFNAVLLAGLVMALAVIVDEAVTDTYAALRRRAGEPAEARSALLDAAVVVRGPLVFATLAIGVTAVPLLLLDGTTGAFYRQLATSYLVAVGVAMVVALTVAPALCGLLFAGGAAEAGEPRLARLLRRGYQAALARIVRQPLTAYTATGVLVVAGLALLPALAGPTLLPPMKDRDLLITWESAPGTSHPEIMRVTSQAVAELREIPGVRRVGGHVGRAVTSDQTDEIDSGQLWLSLDESADYQATTAAVREVAGGYPGIEAVVRTYPEQLVDAAKPASDELVVRVYGDDFAVLREKAEEVRELLTTVDSVSSPRVELATQTPTLEIEVDLTAAERNGIKPGDVRRAAATLVQGLQVGNLFEEQKVFDVVVWGQPQLRRSVSDVANLEIDRPGGGRLRLGDVADVRVAANPSVVRHEATSRYLDVTAEIGGRSHDAVAGDIRTRLQEIEFPLEHHAEVVGQSGESTGTTWVLLSGLAAAVVVFLLLQAAFASWRLAGVLFWVVPAAASGSVVAIALAGGEPTIGSVAGLLAVVGLSIRWLLLSVHQIGRLEREHDTREAEPVIQAAGDRLAPVVLTAAAVVVAVLPLVFLGADPGYEVLRPLAVTLLGGLVTAIALNLFVVPVLCARYGARHVDAGLEPSGRPIEGEPSHA